MERENRLLNHLNHLPRKMLMLHGADNVTEFVLHELCSCEGFNLERAAYFVDNPDFDCLKGVVGFSSQEAYHDSGAIWENPREFSLHMQKAPFNQKVRSLQRESMRRSGESDEHIVNAIASELGLDNPSYYSWDMKHDNHGILIFQPMNKEVDYNDKHLLNGLSLLSFCPVF